MNEQFRTFDDVLSHTMVTRWANASRSNRNASLDACLDFAGESFPQGRKVPLAEIGASDISRWTAKLLQRGLKPATINTKLTAVQAVLTTACTLGAMDKRIPIDKVRDKASRIRVLSQEERNQIAEFFSRARSEQANQASRVTSVLLNTGLRLSEFFDISPTDVIDDRLTIWKSKSGKPRTIPLTKAAKRDLMAYLVGPRLTKDEYRRIWRAMRAQMGLLSDPDFVPHMLRHTCASKIAAAGVALPILQEWLGHANIETTMRYVHFAPTALDQARAALEK